MQQEKTLTVFSSKFNPDDDPHDHEDHDDHHNVCDDDEEDEYPHDIDGDGDKNVIYYLVFKVFPANTHTQPFCCRHQGW